MSIRRKESAMIKIENTEVSGWEAAIRGMRNPKLSYGMSDSHYTFGCDAVNRAFKVGKNDQRLMQTLADAGTDHGKFLRMINVTCDITAPTYWIAEHDTYKVGTVRNSCSFMHKGVSRPFSLSDFSFDKDDTEIMTIIVNKLNALRNEYLEAGNNAMKDAIFFRIRQLLPSGYNQRYTWQANYAVLRNIYHARKNHRLPEWHDFRVWIESLPYSELITGTRE